MFAIVPAYNEAPSVGAVVGALRASGVFADPWPRGGIVVIDDGSTDATAEIAEDAGAMVIRTPKNLGKGGAMLYAYEGLPSVEEAGDDRVAFFDADLVGLTADHVREIAAVSKRGFDMVAGLRVKGPVANVVQIVAPLITGQRIVRRWVLDDLPQTCWSGYRIEVAMNDVIERGHGRTAIVMLPGLSARTKLHKTGLFDGLLGQWKMTRQIAATRKALRSSGGLSCAL
jgi:glycosyltransferase involved in cell wall biosynthesis